MMEFFKLAVWELVCYTLILIVGVLGNLTVCLVILKSGPSHRKFYHVPFNIYLMSLAIVDLALAIVCVPSYLMSTSLYRGYPSGTEGVVLCKTITGYLLCFWLAGTSIYLLVIISFERYTAICKPFQAVARTTSTKTAICIAAAWGIGFLIQLPSAIRIHSVLNTSTVGDHCVYKWDDKMAREITYGVLLFLQYALPAGIFFVNFYRIQKCLTKLDNNLKRCFRAPRHRVKVMNEKRKTVTVVFVVSVAFFICWTPNSVMFFLFQYGRNIGVNMDYNSWHYQAGIVLGFSSSCINPILYAFQSKQFRTHCRKVFRKMFQRTINGMPSSSKRTSYQRIT